MTLRSCLALLVLLTGSACVNGYNSHRSLHYVQGEDGQELLVRSGPPAPAAYEAYLRARIALERDPPQLEEAREQLLIAMRWQSHDPQLWTMLAEIEWRSGALDEADAALEQALSLRPDYSEALALRARMRSPETTPDVSPTPAP